MNILELNILSIIYGEGLENILGFVGEEIEVVEFVDGIKSIRNDIITDIAEKEGKTWLFNTEMGFTFYRNSEYFLAQKTSNNEFIIALCDISDKEEV